MHYQGGKYRGSPPRMRGKHTARTLERVLHRITPAYAGKTRLHLQLIAPCRDHPRVCGENLFVFKAFKIRMGSPPRMRGKRQAHRRRWLNKGITPAYAGKTSWSARKGVDRAGSPPRMRGKRIKKYKEYSNNGITPAYAGKTL